MFTTYEMDEDKLYGSLFGAVIGDALGFPYSGYSAVYRRWIDTSAVKAYKAHRSGQYPPGRFTALSQMLLGVLEALSGKSGRSAGDSIGRYLFPLARDRLFIGGAEVVTMSLEAWARKSSAHHPFEAGNGAKRRIIPPLHLLPLAFLEYENEDALYNTIISAAKPTGHDFPLSLAVASGFIAAVRYAVSSDEIVLGMLIDAVSQAASRFSAYVAERIKHIPDYLFSIDREGTVSFEAELSEPMLFQVLSGITSFVRDPYDVERSLLIVLRNGGGCAAAFVCGALAGVFSGEQKLPPALRENIAEFQEVQRLTRCFRRECRQGEAGTAVVRKG